MSISQLASNTRPRARVAVLLVACALGVHALVPHGRIDAQATMPGMNHGSMAMPDSTRHTMPPDPLGVPMNRAASGTTWIPDAIQLPTRYAMRGSWDLMLHGFAFAEYNAQGGPRGGSQFGSLNWGMFMASHALAGGRFQARTMLSLDAATIGARGYPLLLQSGESYNGVTLHDRQHPHDFFMELGATYERAITKRLGVAFYAAPAGEPALGPVAFLHRPSAMDMPLAPIGHHWQDATHVVFGVVTAGVFTNRWKLEASAFNGREPDQYRWNFDKLALDSWSARIAFNPTAHWALTSGFGYFKSPEAANPTESLHRITASAMHGTQLGSDGQLATTFVLGANEHPGAAGLSKSALIESELIANARHTLLMRAEVVEKSASELAIGSEGCGRNCEFAVGAFDLLASEPHYTVGHVSLGYIREVRQLRGVTLGIGALGTLNVVPSALRTTYGSRTPLGGIVFGRVRVPLRGRAGGMSGMPGMSMSGMSMSGMSMSGMSVPIAANAGRTSR